MTRPPPFCETRLCEKCSPIRLRPSRAVSCHQSVVRAFVGPPTEREAAFLSSINIHDALLVHSIPLHPSTSFPAAAHSLMPVPKPPSVDNDGQAKAGAAHKSFSGPSLPLCVHFFFRDPLTKTARAYFAVPSTDLTHSFCDFQPLFALIISRSVVPESRLQTARNSQMFFSSLEAKRFWGDAAAAETRDRQTMRQTASGKKWTFLRGGGHVFCQFVG